MRELRDPQNGCQIGQVPQNGYDFCKSPLILVATDQTPFEAIIYRFGDVPITQLANQALLAQSLLLYDSCCEQDPG